MSEKMVLRPNPDRWSKPFWEAVQQHDLVFQSCTSCDVQRYPSGPRCSNCGSSGYVWAKSAGAGTVVSWVRFHQNYYPEYDFDLPYYVVLVQLDEGPRMIAGVTEGTTPSTDQRVQVQFVRREADFALPMFATVRSDA